MSEALAASLANIFTVQCILLLFCGVCLGICFGACPGISTSMGIALMLPFTYSLGIDHAMALLVGLYIGGVSGGLISAILLNIPGTPGSISTTFDGHPMAMRGEAGKALGIGIFYSFCGGTLSFLILVVFSPLLARFALKFTAVEYFAITLFSFLLIAGLSGKSLVKGLISACLGVLFTTVGIAPVEGSYRYTFGFHSLDGGLQLITVLIGTYAVAAVLQIAEFDAPTVTVHDYKRTGFGVTWRVFREQFFNFFRSTLIGTAIGILPGLGANIANVLSYTTAQRQSKYPEKFGTGLVDGLIASEASNNAVTGGAMIPLLTLGIPGDGGTALMLAALTIHGVQPGPLMFTRQTSMVYTIFGFMIIANVFMLFAEYYGVKGFLRIIMTPKQYLFPIIMVICMVGAFSTNNRVFDIWAVLFFALVAYGLRKFGFPMPPFVLGFILGGLFEANMRRAMMYTDGTLEGFLDYPIAAGILLCTALTLVVIVARKGRALLKRTGAMKEA